MRASGHTTKRAARLLPAVVGRLTGRRRMLPSFLVVGTKRGGSTSLYEYLAAHPDVLPCAAKKGTHYFDVNFPRGESYFRSCFPLAQPGKITGEASPYYMFHPLAAQRIADTLPEVKLLVALRNPVDRAYSHYQYNVRRGFESLPFAAALEAEEERLAGEVERVAASPAYQSFAHRHFAYLARGRYAEQLEQLYTFVPPERVLVLQSEAMYADANAALTPAWEFLGLRRYELQSVTAFKSGSYAPIPFEARERLESYYAEHNAALYRLPGIGFRWDGRPAIPRPPDRTDDLPGKEADLVR